MNTEEIKENSIRLLPKDLDSIPKMEKLSFEKTDGTFLIGGYYKYSYDSSKKKKKTESKTEKKDDELNEYSGYSDYEGDGNIKFKKKNSKSVEKKTGSNIVIRYSNIPYNDSKFYKEFPIKLSNIKYIYKHKTELEKNDVIERIKKIESDIVMIKKTLIRTINKLNELSK